MNSNIPITTEDMMNTAKTLKEVLPNTVNETDGALSTILGLFNHVVLYPIKKANIEFIYKLEMFEKELKMKLSKIPSSEICEPELSITGPTLESLKYNFDRKEIRELFLSLITSSMDKRCTLIVHPAFVEIIRQLSSLDARLIQMFAFRGTYPVVSIIEKSSDNKLTPYTYDLFYFGDHNNEFSIEEQRVLTLSLDNLIRLGLVNKNSQIIELDFDYDYFKGHLFYRSIEKQKEINSSLVMNKFRIELTELGRAFKTCCLDR